MQNIHNPKNKDKEAAKGEGAQASNGPASKVQGHAAQTGQAA